MSEPLKLFVWHDILWDYTSGMAFALARTEAEAREVIMRGCDDWEAAEVSNELRKAPEVFIEPWGTHVYGGS